MQLLQTIKSALPIKPFRERIGNLEAGQKNRNAIGSYIIDDLKQAEAKATANLYALSEKPKATAKEAIEAFGAYVTARQNYETALKYWSDIASSIGISQSESLTQTEDAMIDLGAGLQAYATELEKRIEQISTDAREMSERCGIEFSEPPAVATLRAELAKVRIGIAACANPEEDRAIVWRDFAPMLRA